MLKNFSYYKQQDKMDCGPTCLRMVAKHYGKTFPIQKLREYCQINRGGVNLLGISDAAEKLGFRSLGVKLSLDRLQEAETIITMVSNTYCQPCAKAHKVLDEWLDKKDDIQLRVIFSTQNNEKDRKTAIASHLMILNEQQDTVTIQKALHDWYDKSNYDSWSKAYPVKGEINAYKSLEKQKEWCKMADITGTPTILINGHRLPNSYQLQDIKYFI